MHNLERYRYWIFDMDGTLTIPVHNFDAIRSDLGIEPGLPILEAIDTLPAARARAAHRRLHELEMQLADDARPQPGVQALLESLHARQYKTGILTRNAEDIAHATLRAAGLAGYFASSDVVGRERCAPKPDPAGLQLLIQQWQASPEQTVMVGDYLFDIEAGRRAGATTIHFDTTATYSWPEFTDLGVSDYAQLQQLLDGS